MKACKVYMVDGQILPGYDFSIERSIIEEAGHKLIVTQCKNDDDIIANCTDADAILDVYTHMGEKSISKLDNCKVMVRYGIGYDSFDMKAATAKGIKVCNIPHYCIPEVATHTTALILGATRNLLNYTMNIRAGKYNTDAGGFLKMHRPSTQIVGLVGFGNISRTVAAQVKGIGYEVIAYDPYLDDAIFTEVGVRRVDLPELFKTAHIISTHAPYFEETHHMIDEKAIAQMQDGVVIVNTARGPLIDEKALLKGLQSGKVGAAGLDVFEEEPFMPADHPFYHMNNVLLSPHAAYNSEESTLELMRQVAQTAVAVLKGELPYNIVNKKELGL